MSLAYLFIFGSMNIMAIITIIKEKSFSRNKFYLMFPLTIFYFWVDQYYRNYYDNERKKVFHVINSI